MFIDVLNFVRYHKFEQTATNFKIAIRTLTYALNNVF
jgi:hypothetical protein